MNGSQLRGYQISRDNFGAIGDGYDQMERLEAGDWHAVASWGRDGWDLGSWPYVVMYRDGVRLDAPDQPLPAADGRAPFGLAVNTEGDFDRYGFPTLALRREAVDYLFAWWAVVNGASWFVHPDGSPITREEVEAGTIPAKFHGGYQRDSAERDAEQRELGPVTVGVGDGHGA